jgi:hypothetical protein
LLEINQEELADDINSLQITVKNVAITDPNEADDEYYDEEGEYGDEYYDDEVIPNGSISFR